MRSSGKFGFVGLLALLGSLIYSQIVGESNIASQVVMFLGLVGCFYWLYMNVEVLLRDLGSRQVKQGSLGLVIVFLGVGVAVAGNYIAQRHPKQHDTTEGGLHTLAPQTDKVVKALEEPVQVLAFLSEGFEGKVRVQGLLENYRVLNPDKIKLRWIDPLYDPNVAEQYGITLDGTVLLEVGSSRRQLTQVTEEELTNALIAVTRKETKKVYFLEGHGEKTPLLEREDSLAQAMGELSKKGFAVETINLVAKGQIPDDARVIISAGPRREFLPAEEQALDAWLRDGGRMILMLDPNIPTQLTSFAAKWGVDAPESTILDQVGQSYIGDATTPVVTPSAQHKITQDLMGSLAIMQMARPLRQGTALPGGSVEMLVASTENAWGETDLSSLTPPAAGENPAPRVVEFNEGADIAGPVNVLALAEWPGAAVSQDPPPADGTSPEGDGKKRQGMLAVFGDSDFISDVLFTQQINGDLFLNTVSFLAQEEDLISIRPRPTQGQPYVPTEAQGAFTMWMSVVVLPGSSFLMALLMYLRRRAM